MLAARVDDLPRVQHRGGARGQLVEVESIDAPADVAEGGAVDRLAGRIVKASGEHEPAHAVGAERQVQRPGLVGAPWQHREATSQVAVQVVVVVVAHVAVALADVLLDGPHAGHLVEVRHRRHALGPPVG
ncbi:MAG TPA: hypothetical protein VGO83_00890 [Thermoleophilaceae bacterium]|nr:hypothetical protein [Thermoleophilaceae bacterium]